VALPAVRALNEVGGKTPSTNVYDYETVGWRYTEIECLTGYIALFCWLKLLDYLKYLNTGGHTDKAVPSYSQVTAFPLPSLALAAFAGLRTVTPSGCGWGGARSSASFAFSSSSGVSICTFALVKQVG